MSIIAPPAFVILSMAKDLLSGSGNRKKQILRYAQDDSLANAASHEASANQKFR